MGELEGKEHLIKQIFNDYDYDLKGSLNTEQLQVMHADMRLGGISISQVKASIEYVCVGEECEKSELFDVLQEMDRRYFLVQDLRWEFSMLDYSRSDTITEDRARWLTEAVHGQFFSKYQWERFARQRAVPGSGVSFAEIEVLLCNIPSLEVLLQEQEQEQKEQAERDRKERDLEKRLDEERERRKRQKDEEAKLKEKDEKKKKLKEEKRQKEEELERQAKQKEKEDAGQMKQQLQHEEEKGLQEAEERERKRREMEEEEKRQEIAEIRRLQELELQKKEEDARRKREEEEAKDIEVQLKLAAEDEQQANEEIDKAKKRQKEATDPRDKKQAEEEEDMSKTKQKDAINRQIRYQLKVDIKKRNIPHLPKSMGNFKKAKLPDNDKDLPKAERILLEHEARVGLERAMAFRQLPDLEKAITFVKRNGFEVQLSAELIEANKILLQLRRLERIRAEILELKQSTVAEIRSYQNPPRAVHTVMTATFLVLGHQEKETKVWKNVQALVGKTGKEGLKRRCLECEPDKINPTAAARAKSLLADYQLDEVRDVSAGAATFYLWSSTMIEELEIRIAQQKAEADEIDRRIAAGEDPETVRKEYAAKHKKAEKKGGQKAADRVARSSREAHQERGREQAKRSKSQGPPPTSRNATPKQSRAKSVEGKS